MKGLLVGFDSPPALEAAIRQLEPLRLEEVETYTPMPRAGSARSPLPLAMFIAGMLGFVGFFLLMTYADVRAYPIDIGGRPRFAWPAFVPIAFELGVLCAMVAGFVGFFVMTRLPHLYDPIDECASFAYASRDRWFVVVRSEAPENLERARAALAPLEPRSVEEFEA